MISMGMLAAIEDDFGDNNVDNCSNFSKDSLFDDFDDDLDAVNMMIGLSENLASDVGGKAAVLHEGEGDEGQIRWTAPKEAGLHNSDVVVAGGGKHWYNEEEAEDEEPLDDSVLVTFDNNININNADDDADRDQSGAAEAEVEAGEAPIDVTNSTRAGKPFVLPAQPLKPQLIKADSADSLFQDEPLPVGNIDAMVSGNIAADAYKDTIEDNPLSVWKAPVEAGTRNSCVITDALSNGKNWDTDGLDE
mmetsp:Transcript_29455/g.95015  ORF Transcript_29455/g.95015 Transcript_29455/m.95015 type:complete len:248 (+) Transcript_29455:99-842(+)|eukprot:scaffold4201_cov119-Isochrysis_galbana.AAC.2